MSGVRGMDAWFILLVRCIRGVISTIFILRDEFSCGGKCTHAHVQSVSVSV